MMSIPVQNLVVLVFLRCQMCTYAGVEKGAMGAVGPVDPLLPNLLQPQFIKSRYNVDYLLFDAAHCVRENVYGTLL